MPTDIDSLVAQYVQGYIDGDPDKIVSCFWPEIIIVTPDTPISGYDNHLRRLRTYVDKTDHIEYEFLTRKDEIGFVSWWGTMVIGDQRLHFHFSCLTEKRGGKTKFIYLHLSPYSPQEGPPYAWIARELEKIEQARLITDINALEMQQAILRLERENQELRDRLENDNMTATGIVIVLNTRHNPPVFVLSYPDIYQTCYISKELLAETGLRNGMEIRVIESHPIREKKGSRDITIWMIEQLEVLN